jgi:hypothetical protein
MQKRLKRKKRTSLGTAADDDRGGLCVNRDCKLRKQKGCKGFEGCPGYQGK